MRDDLFLAERLNQIWNMLFPEVERKNNIIVRFKGKWRNKFGHIKLLKDKTTEIAINSHFKNLEIPEYIIDLTLAHELVHYMHGFNSPLEKRFRHPHKGNIVNRELVNRGFGSMLRLEKAFVRQKWPEFLKQNHARRKQNINPMQFLRKLALRGFF